jgi:hypothetical protein
MIVCSQQRLPQQFVNTRSMYEREFSEDKFFMETGVEMPDLEHNLRTKNLLQDPRVVQIREEHSNKMKAEVEEMKKASMLAAQKMQQQAMAMKK